MAEVKKQTEQQPAAAAPVQAPRPNRDRYASMFGEDNPDIDFEDKEARYGRMSEERDELRTLRNSGRQLSGILQKHRWVGAMLMDNEENPLVWMAKNGIDVKAALDDPEVMKKVTDAFSGWTKRQADGEAAEKAKDEALGRSYEALDALQAEMGFSDEQKNRMNEYFWDEMWLPAWNGEVSKDVWTAVMHAMNYDQDIASAREQAGIQARNEKYANRLKTFDEQQVPPSFSQGQGQRSTQQKKKEGLWDDLKDYH